MHAGVCIAGVTPGKERIILELPDGGMHPGTCIPRVVLREYRMMGGNACQSMHDVGGVYREGHAHGNACWRVHVKGAEQYKGLGPGHAS
jgi:hypothetical protein